MCYRGAWLFCVGILFLSTTFSEAQLKLPFYFSDHMVIQRGQKIVVWGIATPRTTVVVSLNGKIAKTEANAQGRWQLSLPPMKEGGPYELEVKIGRRKNCPERCLHWRCLACLGAIKYAISCFQSA